jgi:hypothetical protein
MNPDTLVCIWILVNPIVILEVSTTQKWGFEFFSVCYKITELQATKKL